MGDFWFYITLGLDHVLDLSAYDHILFLTALSLPFTFRSWKKVLVLVTVFTIAHCTSLGLSVYGIVVMDSGLIEFFIPLTILFTAIFNMIYLISKTKERSILLHTLATTFFGLIHGFGFSNYFKMLVSGQGEEKIRPLLGFATGIELSQVLIVMAVLVCAYIAQSFLRLKQDYFIMGGSILVIFIAVPMLAATYPW